MIASLREGSGASGDAAGVSNLEYDTVKQERDMFKEEIQQSRMTIDNYRVELAVGCLYCDFVSVSLVHVFSNI